MFFISAMNLNTAHVHIWPGAPVVKVDVAVAVDVGVGEVVKVEVVAAAGVVGTL